MINGTLYVGYTKSIYSPHRNEVEVPNVFELKLQGDNEVKLVATDGEKWMTREQLARCLEDVLSIINERD